MHMPLSGASRRAAEINAQYNAFASDFAAVEQLYVTAINEQSTGTVTVSTTVTAAYTPPSPLMQVKNASVFFPNGSTTPVTATATRHGWCSDRHFLLDGFLR